MSQLFSVLISGNILKIENMGAISDKKGKNMVEWTNFVQKSTKLKAYLVIFNGKVSEYLHEV